jgi:hypothetical protein
MHEMVQFCMYKSNTGGCSFSMIVLIILISLDEPTQPGRPNILDWGPNHCDLSWTPPESDGGAPITHYVIEMKVSSVASRILDTAGVRRWRPHRPLRH